jgi:hypothetical protein
MKLGRLIKKCLNETYSKVGIGKDLSDSFPIQNGLKQGAALWSLIFNFALQYAIRKFQENQVGLKLNGTHQILAYADDIILVDGSKDVGLNAKIEETKYTWLSLRHKAGQNLDIK